MDEKEQKLFADRIMENIRERRVTMRPRWYFLLRDILGITAIVIALLVAVYFASFIIFVLHQNGAWFVPVFGLAGWWSLFTALPWVLIFLTVAFNILLAFLARRFRRGYERPFVYTLFAIASFIAIMSFAVIQTSMVQQFFTSRAARDIPFLGEYYPGIGVLSPNDVHRGAIVQVTQGGFRVQDDSGNRLRVFVTGKTVLPSPAVFHVGDVVVVFGVANTASGTIQAVGIEKLTD